MTVSHAKNNYPYHAEHGVLIDDRGANYAEMEEEYEHHNDLLWTRIRHHLREPIMEFMGMNKLDRH